MLKAIVFDFDGTLAESADIKTKAFATLFRAYPEHVERIVQYHLAHMGISRFVKFRTIYNEILKRPLSSSDEERLGEAFRTLVSEQMLTCPLVEGASAFLQEMSRRYSCFIASGAPEGELREIVTQRGLAKYFTGMFGSPDSKAAILRNIMRTYRLVPSQMLYIGDATSDFDAAESERVFFIGRLREADGNPFPPGGTIVLVRDFVELQRTWPALLAALETSKVS